MVVFVEERCEMFKCLQQFFNEIKTRLVAVLKIFRSDNALEFVLYFSKFLS